jgi:flagellar basal-body rod protein FlgF
VDVSSYVLLSQEQALRRRLDVAANNMANMSTAGFKREQPVFREYVEQAQAGAVPEARSTSFVLDYGAVHDTALGTFQPTGNPLDVMIDGPGYLAVRTPDGSTGYTRAGALKVTPTGELATASGQLVLGEGGAPVTIPPDQVGELTMTADGTISSTQGPLGRLAVTTFADERMLEPRGDGLLTGQGGRELTASETHLHSGGIESSNVQPIVETTSMVEILRAYQTSMSMSSSLDDMRQRAITRLGKIN